MTVQTEYCSGKASEDTHQRGACQRTENEKLLSRASSQETDKVETANKTHTFVLT